MMQMQRPRPNHSLYEPLLSDENAARKPIEPDQIEMSEIKLDDRSFQEEQLPPQRSEIVDKVINMQIQDKNISSFPDLAPRQPPQRIYQPQRNQFYNYHQQAPMPKEHSTSQSQTYQPQTSGAVQITPKESTEEQPRLLQQAVHNIQRSRIEAAPQPLQLLQPQVSYKRIECGACKGVMQYDSSAFLVKCPFCTSVNYTTPIGVLKCGACFTDSFYPLHSTVMACQCGAINQVPAQR